MFHPTQLLAAADPLSHVLDKTLIGPGGKIEAPFTILTMNTLILLVVTGVFIWAMLLLAKHMQTGPETEGAGRYIPKSKFAQFFEAIIVYIRDTVIQPQLGDDTRKFMPFLLTLFFFILFMNLAGLVPLIDLQYLLTYGVSGGESHTSFIGGTATGRISVTAALALIAFGVWNVNGIQKLGLKGWLHHFTGHAPWYIWPIMIPVEILGAFVKPAALAIRLFANMTAGHVLLAALLGFTGGAVGALGIVGGTPVAIVAFVGGVLVYFLEIFVATLQAFIFLFLTTVFIGLLNHSHDDHHEDEYQTMPISEDSVVGA